MKSSRAKSGRIALCTLFVWVTFTVLSSAAMATQPKAWKSWQIDNPAWTGILSAASFGLWPGTFANDLQPAGMYYVDAISDGAVEYAKAHSARAFRVWRNVTFAAEAALVLGLLVWRHRRSRRRLAAASLPSLA